MVISDSAFKNLKSKHSQGGYAILLVRSEGVDSVGGLCHVLEFNSRKSRRVVKSTWGAEMHALISALERAERIYYWLKEIWQGPSGIPGIDRVESMINTDSYIAVQACVDCKGLYDSITSPVVGSLTDMSMQLYLIALRETMRVGPLSELCWIETHDMLVDAQTKWMDDVLWKSFYRTSYWSPTEATCTRRRDRGQLERFTKTLVALTYSYLLDSSYLHTDIEYEILAMLGQYTTEQVLFHDLCVT